MEYLAERIIRFSSSTSWGPSVNLSPIWWPSKCELKLLSLNTQFRSSMWFANSQDVSGRRTQVWQAAPFVSSAVGRCSKQIGSLEQNSMIPVQPVQFRLFLILMNPVEPNLLVSRQMTGLRCTTGYQRVLHFHLHNRNRVALVQNRAKIRFSPPKIWSANGWRYGEL